MSVSLVVNGNTYEFPEVGEEEWGEVVTAWAEAITNGTLQKAGGTFTLQSDLNFGVNFGLRAIYYKSPNSNISDTGIIRLNNTDFIGWKNFANDADLELGVDTSDRLTFNGNPILPSTALTASRAIQTNASGVFEVSATTSTELGYVHGVTSALQTQLDAKIGTTLASARLLVGNGSNVATAVDITGDVLISNAGVTSINAGVIVNADINASAGINFSKMEALTVSRALSSSAGGVVAVATTTLAELNFVNGVTSAIQTQLDAKEAFKKGVVTVSSANRTGLATDAIVLFSTGASNRTYDVVTAVGNTGQRIWIKKTDTGAGYVLIDPAGSETVDGYSKVTLHLKNEAVEIVSDGTNWQIVGYRQSDPAAWTPTYGAVTGTYTSVSTTSQWWKSAINQVNFYIFASGTTNSVTAGLTFTLPLATTANAATGHVFAFGYRGETSASALVWSIESTTVATIYQSQGGTWNAAAARTLRGQSTFLIDPTA